ncbi:uncharacterized protein ACR2FA_003191 [Aphomia sociella]
MSFITKRERVFNEYDLFDLPARDEGKLKAYASCTDARAWSHFCSDKSEHLVEIIKRNNETCRTKYVPTDVIVDTLMVAKNAEIGRLKRRIEEFEQILAAYDQLDLTYEQKCEIANAHAAIKAANKELDELCLDLNMSEFTEGVESDAFEIKSLADESDKSRGDEWAFEKEPTTTESKANHVELTCPCDASTSIHDPRIQEMQDAIISKDAKLNAMQNTIAVMENDVCEPYCIYAHIYTALEKIFGILCQNQKYKLYLNLMTAGKDTRCIDIKGKILFKLKVLEKFCLALIAPCSQEINSTSQDCSCFRAEITFALTSAESKQPSLDNKRAHLVADIMENEEMKEILSKDSASEKMESEQVEDIFTIDEYNINSENLNRLKKLQENYDDLMTCHEALKHEKNCLQIRCQKYEELEMEYENLKARLREYDLLWNEKEHYRKRSVDLDSLKEQYLMLTDETSNLETRLKAELEINHMKADTIQELRDTNVALEKKLNESFISFEKEKSNLQCKLKETECKVMCQEQQIKSLSVQIDRLLEQDQDKIHTHDVTSNSLLLINELESSKDQIKSLKEALFCIEEEKENLQLDFQEKLEMINELRIEIEDWKTTYEKTIQHSNYIKNNYDDEMQRLKEENLKLSQYMETKNEETNNLINVINYKSQQIDKLMEENEKRNNKNKNLYKQLNEIREMHDNHIKEIEKEKKQSLEFLTLAKQESQELLSKVKDYNDVVNKQKDLTISLEAKTKNYSELQKAFFCTMEENKSLQNDLSSQKNSNTILLQEIQKLQEDNNEAINNINSLNDDNNQYKTSLEMTIKKSEILENKLVYFENISQKLEDLQVSHKKLILENSQIDAELREKTILFDNAIKSITVENEELKDQLIKLKQKCEQLSNLEEKFSDLQGTYNDLLIEKKILQNDFDNIKQEYNNLHNNLESKIEQNKHLCDKIQYLENNKRIDRSNINALENENIYATTSLNALYKEKALLESEFEKLKTVHEQMLTEKEKTQNELNFKLADLKRLKQENSDLHRESENLLTETEDLEKALRTATNLLVEKSTSPPELYSTVYKEIENMKREKILNNNKIRELLDKLDESENIISTLSEDILAQDDKISILENHINELEDEVRRLHNDIAEAVDTGEQISNTSYEKIDQSLKKLEAHHSRATHNMKKELAMLQSEKYMLEEQLSTTKLKTENSTQDRNKYLSQIKHLQNERDIIVTDIKQLELKSVGDSALSPNKCDIEDILLSLDRVRKVLDEKISKSSSLEQTLLKVQTSSQLLLIEAKEIVEKEKQKIINEKEEAVRDRINMEKKLDELKIQLEEQISRDKYVIIDLEAKLLNQKLIEDKINNASQTYISKLKEEMQSLQNMYQNSIEKVSELQEKVYHMTEEKNGHLEMFNRINLELAQKCKDISELQKALEDINNKERISIGIQVLLPEKRNVTTLTDKDVYTDNNTYSHTIESVKQTGKLSDNNNINTFLTQKAQSVNEVQILTANTELSFDFVKSSYLNYKIQRLSPGRLEQQSVQTNSSNDMVDKDAEIKKDNISPKKSSAVTEYDFTIDSFETESNDNNTVKNSTVIDSTSGKSTDKDLFIIYKDSEINYEESSHDNKKTWNDQSQILVESLCIIPNKKNKYKMVRKKEQNQNKYKTDNDFYLEEEENDDDSVKPRLKINMPRIETNSPSITMSDCDKKSLDSYTTPKHVTYAGNHNNENTEYTDQESPPSFLNESNCENQNEDSCNSLEITLQTNKQTNKKVNHKSKHHVTNESHHKLSRVGADVFIIKSDFDNNKIEERQNGYNINDRPTRSSENFGLQYILDTVHREINPDNNNMQATVKSIWISRSDERFNLIKTRESSNSSPSKLSPLKFSSVEYKTVSSPSVSKSSHKNKSKSFVERSVMVKIDDTDDYEIKIQYLTKALENIEKEYKKKIEVIKLQYDSNIKNIINEHNQGVKSIQNLHEETLQDILKMHENEVESLRTLSIEAMRKSDKLEKENQKLKTKIQDYTSTCYEPEPLKITALDGKKRRKSRIDTKMLSKTNVEAFNVKPKSRSHGPCTCSLDVNISDTIRNIFDQVDIEQRKMSEHAYIKYIANKILNNAVEALDAQELSFLHLKVCRIWKMKLSKEEVLQKRINSLEHELLNKQRYAQQHIAELDRKVAEERRRLQEVREAVCSTPLISHDESPELDASQRPPPPQPIADKDLKCNCNTVSCNVEQSDRRNKAGTSNLEVCERRSAGDLVTEIQNSSCRTKRIRIEKNRAVLVKLDVDERREKRNYNDELPTRLRRSHVSRGAERQTQRSSKNK